MHRQSEKNLFVLSYSVIMEFGYLQISRYRTSLWNLVANFELSQFLPLKVNCVRFCFWRCLWLFLLCVKYLGNRWTDLRQIHTEDVFGPSLGRVWRSRSRSISAACVRFVFEKTSLLLFSGFSPQHVDRRNVANVVRPSHIYHTEGVSLFTTHCPWHRASRRSFSDSRYFFITVLRRRIIRI